MEARIPGQQSAHETECLPASEVLPTTSNVRSRVHEYGGGAVMVANGYAYWSEFNDNRVWCRKMDAGYLEPLGTVTRGRSISRTRGGRCATDYSLAAHTRGGSSTYRYADFDFHPTSPNLIICVREDHTRGGQSGRQDKYRMYRYASPDRAGPASCSQRGVLRVSSFWWSER